MEDNTVSGSSDVSENKDSKSNKTDSNSAPLPHTNSFDRKHQTKHGQNRLRQSFRKLLGRKQKDDSTSTTG